MKRNPLNTNHHLHEEATYQGYAVQTVHGPLIEEHLKKTFDCFQRALDQYPRVSMMRFDLHIPENYLANALGDNSLINRFFSSLRSQIQHSQSRSRKQGNRVHDTEVRYTWGRELSGTGRLHYHVTLLLNHDAYAHIGDFNLERSNMYSRIHKAWESALGIFRDDLVGMIHIPENSTYMVKRDDMQSREDAFYRASYLCKMDTKEYGQGFHSFGSSRI